MNIITKYRPKGLSEIVGQEKLKVRMRTWIEKLKQGLAVPNLLFVGEPGIGKTTMAFAIAYELFGEDWKNYVLEMNASDERGIDAMREKVKRFAQSQPSFTDVRVNLIILDEADYLTPEAQAILRRLMEDYAKYTKFILCCNWLNRIIEPIKDRCAIYRMEKYSDEEIIEIVRKVAQQEGIGADVERIANQSNGSIRKALNMLFADVDAKTEVNTTVTTKNLKDLLYAYDVESVLDKVFEQICSIRDAKVRAKLALKLMDAEYHIKFGCNPYLQLYGVVSAWEIVTGSSSQVGTQLRQKPLALNMQ